MTESFSAFVKAVIWILLNTQSVETDIACTKSGRCQSVGVEVAGPNSICQTWHSGTLTITVCADEPSKKARTIKSGGDV